jgi:DNA-binding response OmpR family regulator
MKVLLVEDHPALGRISCDLLRDVYGHEVTCAQTGAAAEAQAAEFAPDIVLIDVNLPDMSGYDLARRFRANASFDQTRLVALTGFGNLIDPQKAAAAGVDASFRKPMDFAVLPTITRQSA